MSEDRTLEEQTPEEQVEAERQPLFLHIGLPKSGSTFLQSVLGGHRLRLKDHGFLYPYVRQEGMFHAALEMAGRPQRWGLEPEDVQGTFAHLLRRARRLGGTVVISHEIFSAATAEQVERIAERLVDFDVHVVVTVRNVGRTLTAEWQERVKNGHDESFATFADRLLATLPPESDGVPDATMVGFWRSQNLGWILDKWRRLAPPERTHLVVTPVGGGPDLLWRRFAGALEIPDGAVDLDTGGRGNESLGVAQIAFLRRVLAALDGRLEHQWFHVVAKRWFAQSVLSRAGGAKPVTPPAVAHRLVPVTRRWIDLVESEGYRVHGDLAELLPVISDGETPDPDEATVAEMLEPLPGVVAEMLLHERDLRARVAGLERGQRVLADERDRLASRTAELEEALAEAQVRRWPGRERLRPVAARLRAVRARDAG